jgi:hypothetical protein
MPSSMDPPLKNREIGDGKIVDNRKELNTEKA